MRNEFMRWSCGLALILVAISPRLAAAQGPAAATLVEGRRSIQLGGINGGAASFGFWKMRDARTNLGIVGNVDLNVSRVSSDTSNVSSTNTGLSFSVGPELRRYTAIAGRVAPYGFIGGALGALVARHSDSDADSETRWRAFADARVGLGAEYFPTESFSIGGQMGVGADFTFDPEPLEETTSWGLSIGTFGASIMAAVYF